MVQFTKALTAAGFGTGRGEEVGRGGGGRREGEDVVDVVNDSC